MGMVLYFEQAVDTVAVLVFVELIVQAVAELGKQLADVKREWIHADQ